MSTPFSDEEVIKRTARRLGTNDTRVRDFLRAYCDEWLTHAQETGHGQYAHVEPTAKAPTKPAGKARSPRKAPAKVRTPAKSRKPAEGESTGEALGNAMVSAAMRQEAKASVALDGETHTVGAPVTEAEAQEQPAGSPS